MQKQQKKPKDKKSEKEEVLNELARILKSDQKEKSEENKESKTDKKAPKTDLENFQFNSFMTQTQNTGDSSAPVLERITGQQGTRPIFFSGSSQNQESPTRSESSDSSYIPSSEQSNEPKYSSSIEQVRTSSEKIDFTRVGRTERRQQEVSMRQDPRVTSSFTQERTWQPERTNFQNAGRKDPFENDEVKYVKYDPKLPK